MWLRSAYFLFIFYLNMAHEDVQDWAGARDSPPLSSAHSGHQGVAVAAAVFSPARVSRLWDGQPRSASLASLVQSGI